MIYKKKLLIKLHTHPSQPQTKFTNRKTNPITSAQTPFLSTTHSPKVTINSMLNIHLPHSITMNNKYFARLETYKHTEKRHTHAHKHSHFKSDARSKLRIFELKHGLLDVQRHYVYIYFESSQINEPLYVYRKRRQFEPHFKGKCEFGIPLVDFRLSVFVSFVDNTQLWFLLTKQPTNAFPFYNIQTRGRYYIRTQNKKKPSTTLFVLFFLPKLYHTAKAIPQSHR